MGSKKRVLVFIPEFPVLTETFIERELAKLVERNTFDIVVFSIKRGDGSFSDVLKDKVYYKRFNVLDLFYSLFYITTHLQESISLLRYIKGVRKEDKNENKGRKESVSYESIFLTFVKSIGYSRKISYFKPDFILCHFLSFPSSLIMFVSRLTNIPYGISAHAKDVLVDSEFVEQKVNTSKFITICNKYAYDFLRDKVNGSGDASKLYLLYHGVDVKKVRDEVDEEKEIKEINETSESSPVILSIARFVQKKGLSYLIEASKILKDRGISHKVKIIGSGPLYSSLIDDIKKFNVEDCVEIVGENKGLSNKDTLNYLSKSNVYVFSSIQTDMGDADGIANVLLEAGVFKIPVVATDSGSTSELIRDGYSGLLINQKSSVNIADAVEKLLVDRDLSSRLGNGLYGEICDKFDLDKNIVGLEGLLLKDY